MELVPKPLLDGVIRVFNPVQVILFGSRARGDHREDSDIDLYVVVDDDTPDERLTGRQVGRARLDYPKAVDIVLARRADHDRRRVLIGALAKRVSEEGRTVYERD